MIKSRCIQLRVWRDSDLAFLTDLRNDVALQAKLLARARGSKEDQVRQWLARFASDAGNMLFIIASLENDDPLGYLQINGIDDVSRSAELGICLGPQAQGRGYGGEAIQLVGEYLRRIWNMRKLSVKVSANNPRALRCYEKKGFQRCGLQKQHVFMEGEWHDVVLMEKFLAAVD